MKQITNSKVFVAMSGGVDSSVAAWLLKKEGYHVTGVHFKLAVSHEKEVNKICQKIGIPFLAADFKREFHKLVIKDFISQYKAGLTPNPCIYCNRWIKFDLFYRWAKKLGADYIATGHYVGIVKKKNSRVLKKGLDPMKDQSYFLWDLKPEVLPYCLFPLGNLAKKKTQKIAQQNLLPVFKSESQEVCFITGKTSAYLLKNIKSHAGLIKEFKTKKILGKHQGLFLYTIGQRSGLGLEGGPWYVVKKDIAKKILWVTKNENDLYDKILNVKDVNWLLEPKKFPVETDVKTRYRHSGSRAIIKRIGKNYKVIFCKPERALTSGQSAVFYKGDKLLGGGIME